MNTDKNRNSNTSNQTVADNGGEGIVYRCVFTKGETVRYISHLDTMRTMERAFRKAGIPLSYSRGFNPHPSLVFGLPLSVGMSSEAELVDIGCKVKISAEEMLSAANAALPDDIRLLSARQVGPKEKVMSNVCGAVYGILIRTEAEFDDLISAVEKVLDADEIAVERETKQRISTVNIRPLINMLSVSKAENFSEHTTCGVFPNSALGTEVRKRLINAWHTAICNEKNSNKGYLYILKADVTAGSQANLRADTLICGIAKVTQKNIEMLKVHRIVLNCRTK